MCDYRMTVERRGLPIYKFSVRAREDHLMNKVIMPANRGHTPRTTVGGHGRTGRVSQYCPATRSMSSFRTIITHIS